MNFYKLGDAICASIHQYDDLYKITELAASKCENGLYYLGEMEVGISKRSFCLYNPGLINNFTEGPHLLKKEHHEIHQLPIWFNKKISNRKITFVNTSYPKWKDVLDYTPPTKWKVNVIGLGDVGGTLAIGLRLMASDCISEIGIFDLDSNKKSRWKYELGQIHYTTISDTLPKIKVLEENELFNCDMFVFCVSIGVPPLSETKEDVRMLQFEGNSKIVNHYAKLARLNNFKGIFSVVSDPVELLCKSAFLSSNTSETGVIDFCGLAPEQIRGYGLGVMNARALYYASEIEEFKSYLNEGRAFGQHGEGLIIVNSIKNYDEFISSKLTEIVKYANIEIRKTGFKPYIAPALSSGSLSLIDTIKGKWHYSSNFIGGVYFGARNRLLKSGVELETMDLPDKLFNKISEEFFKLGEFI